jgi:hypothetical protein
MTLKTNIVPGSSWSVSKNDFILHISLHIFMDVIDWLSSKHFISHSHDENKFKIKRGHWISIMEYG